MRSPVFWMENLASTRSAMKTSGAGLQQNPAPEEEHAYLEPRKMHDSYAQVILPFASQPELLEKYVNASGGIRTGTNSVWAKPSIVWIYYMFTIGKLMEHLDSLAGSISYKYVLGASVERLGAINDAGFYIVTASIDRYADFNLSVISDSYVPNPARA